MMTKITTIKSKISKLQAQLYKIQDECSHPPRSLKSVNKGSTGNYDPSADCYWIEYHCTLCDKQWNEDQ